MVYKFSFYFILISILAFSCSSERHNMISKAYHNTTARYNAYFIAKEKMKEAEVAIYNSRNDDFNRVLEVFPDIESGTISNISPLLEDCIKKASLPIQWHKNSKWVDDCYILVGKARIYKQDYENAITTFKYVNTQSEDDDTRHQALILLIQVFINTEEYNNCIAVIDHIEKDKLNKHNSRELYLIKARLHKRLAEHPPTPLNRQEYEKVIENLTSALPLIGKREKKGRIHFIIGQINQKLGSDDEAYFHYKSTLKNNPPYELEFYARLYMAQVYELSKTHDIKRIQKYFKKLLKDSKNVEYRDKIYYEMAQFELKQNNILKAITYLKESIRASTANANQKAYSYLKMGEIHYENLQKYELAKAYYDSTIATLDKNAEDYEAIVKRQKVLEEFVEQINIIYTEDSLQRLAKMDTAKLSKYLNEIIAINEAKRKKELEEKQQSQNSPDMSGSGSQWQNFNNPNTSAGSSGKWYFYNPGAMSRGQQEFLTKWRNRKLEDNWRRSNKQTLLSFDDPDNKGSGTMSNKKSGDDFSKGRLKKEDMYENIPFAVEQLEASNKRIIDAYYKLGNIYNLKLKEPLNAIKTYKELLKRFPENEYAVEVIYILHILYKELDEEQSEKYKKIILGVFPKSLYAKIIKNPDYMKVYKIANEKVKVLYKSAYQQYEIRHYTLANASLDDILSKYPDSDFEDRIIILKAIILGKTHNTLKYKNALISFITAYKSSDLIPYAKRLLKTCNNYISGNPAVIEEIEEKLKVNYIEDLEKVHFFVAIFPDNLSYNEILTKFSDYNKTYYETDALKTKHIILNDTSFIVMVKEFSNKNLALNYLNIHKGFNSPLKQYKDVHFELFVITDDNFPLFYQAKDVESYLTFFREKYY
ncbi:MAG: tetratricopeptide repeat protein [Bacteroidetes bacterium]|nr:tetratricopeptide repeat protein [Bacteroidota bacterium]